MFFSSSVRWRFYWEYNQSLDKIFLDFNQAYVSTKLICPDHNYHHRIIISNWDCLRMRSSLASISPLSLRIFSYRLQTSTTKSWKWFCHPANENIWLWSVHQTYKVSYDSLIRSYEEGLILEGLLICPNKMEECSYKWSMCISGS